MSGAFAAALGFDTAGKNTFFVEVREIKKAGKLQLGIDARFQQLEFGIEGVLAVHDPVLDWTVTGALNGVELHRC